MTKTMIAFALLLLASFAFARSCYVTFAYEPSTETLTQVEMEVMDVEAPEAVGGGNVGLSVVGSGGEIFSTTARVPLFTSQSYTEENMPEERALGVVERAEFSALLPCDEGALRVVVKDTNGTEMASFDLPPPATPTPVPTGTPHMTPTPEPTPGPMPADCPVGLLLLPLGAALLFTRGLI